MIKVLPIRRMLFLAIIGLPQCVLAQDSKDATPRTPVPDWSHTDTSAVFFADAFRDAFDQHWPPSPNVARRLSDPDESTDIPSTPNATRFAWSAAIDNELLIDEVKRLTITLQRGTRSRSTFDRYGAEESQVDMATLAVLFRIIGDWDGDSRFREDGRPMSRFLTRQIREMANGKEFEVAQQTSRQLLEIIAGNTISTGDASAANDGWQDVVRRSDLMIRIESAVEVNLERGLQTVESMTSGRHELCCDANLVTALFGAMCRPGAADSDQVRYVNYCKSAARHSLFLRKAILLGQHDEAVQSLAKLRQSCTDCHDRYR